MRQTNQQSKAGWTIAEAQSVIGELTEIASRNGYLIALYGSVLTKGQGRDLDFLLVPKRPMDNPLYVIVDISEQLDAPIRDSYEGLAGTYSAALELRDGRILDLQVYRLVPNTGHGRSPYILTTEPLTVPGEAGENT